jgi:prolyl-tRNA editing enzyme YbaK/EbsC (Cys-tRNA(Pro) deacylase)
MQTSVTQFLDSVQAAYTLKPHQTPVYTCEDAARERGLRVSQVVKCMVGQDQQSYLHIMLLPGDKILKLKRVRQLAGSLPIHLLPPEELAQRYDLMVGAISPFQFLDKAKFHITPRFYIDPTVRAEEDVSVSSGHPSAGILLKSALLLELLQATQGPIISTR